jgi:hypothetical protein
MVPFFRKKPMSLSLVQPWPRAKFKQGADNLAERARKPEIAYASTRIRPFSLTPGPAGCLRKSNSPNSNLLRQRKKQNSAIKNNKHLLLHQMFETKRSFIYMATRPTY